MEPAFLQYFLLKNCVSIKPALGPNKPVSANPLSPVYWGTERHVPSGERLFFIRSRRSND